MSWISGDMGPSQDHTALGDPEPTDDEVWADDIGDDLG